MAYENNCAADRKNLGLVNFCPDIALVTGFAIVSDTQEFATQTAAETLANWTTGINAVKKDRFNVFPQVLQVETAGEETVYEEFPTGVNKVRDGKIAWRFSHPINTYLQRALRSQNRNSGRIYLFYQNGKIGGTSPDGTKFQGFDINLLSVENPTQNDGSVGAKALVYVVLSAQGTSEYLDAPYTIDPTKAASTWSPGNLTSLIDVNVTVSGTPSLTSLILDVKDAATGTGITGLVLADFLILTAAGADQTPDSVAEDANVEGRYNFTDTNLETGTANLKAPSAQTTKGYEGGTAASFTV